MAAAQIKPDIKEETIVASVHGNGVFSDNARPVFIHHRPEGAFITMAPATAPSSTNSVVTGRAHYILPTLHAPYLETWLTTSTKNLVILGTELYIAVSPCVSEDNSRDTTKTPEYVAAEIIRVDLYAGRDLLESWGQGTSDQQVGLPAQQDFKLTVGCGGMIYGAKGMLNENPQGLGVTLTIKFGDDMGHKADGNVGLLISSVAIIQKVAIVDRLIKP